MTFSKQFYWYFCICYYNALYLLNMSIMVIKPILLGSYVVDKRHATLQYAWELIISQVLDPEIARISEQLCDVFDTDIIDEYFKHIILHPLKDQKDALIFLMETRTPYGNIPKDISENMGNLSRELKNIDKQIIILEATNELEKKLLSYHMLLDASKTGIINIISNNIVLKTLIAKNKWARTLIHTYEKFFDNHMTESFEEYENICMKLNGFYDDIEFFEYNFDKR